MKTLKDIILEATTEVNPLPRRTKNFIAKHTVQKIDYPVDAENQFTAKSINKDKTKGASYHNGEDSVVYEETELEEAMKLDKDNVVHARGSEAEAFAKEYVKGHKGEYTSGGPSEKHEKDSEKFHGTYKRIGGRQGFGGSGHDIYQHKETGVKFRVDRNSNGKGFYGTDHMVSKLNEEVEQIDELSKSTLGSYATKALHRADIAGRMSHSDSDEMGKIAAKRTAGVKKAVDKIAPKKAATAIKTNIDKAGEAAKNRGTGKDDQGKAYYAAQKGIAKVREETEFSEATMSDAEMKKREDIVKGMKKNAQSFKDRYGDRWKSVMYATATKAAVKEAMDPVGKEDSDIDNNGKVNASDKYLARRRKAIAASVKEEVEQIDEISQRLATRAYGKRARDAFEYDDSGDAKNSDKAYDKSQKTLSIISKKYGKSGVEKAHAQGSGEVFGGKKPYTEEVEQIDEAFRAGSMKLHDGSSITLTKESADVLNNLFNQLNSSNKVKMEERLMSSSKGFDEILAFAKEV